MDTAPIQTKTLLTALAGLTAVEFIAAKAAAAMGSFPLAYLGALRVIEAALLVLIAAGQRDGVGIIGLSRRKVLPGIKTGAGWSFAFAVLAAAGMGVLWFLGDNPLQLLKVPLPDTHWELISFFVVGGLIAPIAEEIFFRGYLFGYLARWGIAPAIFLSTLIFLFFHPQGGLTQIVGGIVFSLAYYFSQSLIAAIMIHSLGNLALFFISLFTRLLSQ